MPHGKIDEIDMEEGHGDGGASMERSHAKRSSNSSVGSGTPETDGGFGRDVLQALDREYQSRNGRAKRQALLDGLVCIGAVVFLWVSASELIRER